MHEYQPKEDVMVMTITVRYTQGTYVARAKGHRKTASCVYDAGMAAKALASKLGLDGQQLVMTKGERDHLEFILKPEGQQQAKTKEKNK